MFHSNCAAETKYIQIQKLKIEMVLRVLCVLTSQVLTMQFKLHVILFFLCNVTQEQRDHS